MKAPLVLLAFMASTALAGSHSRAARPGVVVPPSAVDNNMSCDIGTYPAATLLLPYFQVETSRHVNDAQNTIFSIVNTSRTPQIARVTIWTDYGYPAFWFNIFLTGFDMQSISLYDVIANGTIPQTSSATAPGSRSKPNDANPNIVSMTDCDVLGGPLPESARASLTAMLTTGTSEASCRLGAEHASIATGYVTVDVVSTCANISPLDPAYYAGVLLFDNVLTGDWERIAPARDLGNYAGGNPMVHIRAIPEGGAAGSVVNDGLPHTFYDRFTPANLRRVDRRQPLPSRFAARYIEGGTGSFRTDFSIWREAHTSSATGCVNANAAIPYMSIVRYDEYENPTIGSESQVLPVAVSAATSSSTFPPRGGFSVSGWIFLDLDNHAGVGASSPYSSPRASQNWVTIHMRAEGRFGVDYDATALGNGCATPQAGGGVTK